MARAPEHDFWPVGHPWAGERNLFRFQVFLLALLISCWLPAHEPNSKTEEARCQAKTREGTQCRRIAPPGQRSCWQHRAERLEPLPEGREGKLSVGGLWICGQLPA